LYPVDPGPFSKSCIGSVDYSEHRGKFRLGLDDELYREPYMPKAERRKYDYTLDDDDKPRDVDGRFMEWE
jgi:hypothetical protein